ncbi:proteasome complex subunit Rpn13 ubiquitin receptor-domain-containing protein [Zychaea mexicana]|uniref:proteasome complex subunit Rpn13 ubiquitin receptor-domain-containing protein n=1 Tax=Zychaea mexicana TaxID=64656 RepID=UPI0022FEB999|nr:proteasome complex subunit Rpn13 ubiquitin receptor-domain-containing protein [Zychaea mexicana]KAI9496764.1 proteasome complex subunit Rpn13 ubiquitin receptor-domain-containing protein [Zychaea mexicana]
MSFFPTAQRPKYLVQFNAGKCIREGNTIKPDLRKGMIYMDQTDEQLMYFYWKERKSSTEPEEERIIFPDEAEFVRVTQCTTGRVYSLNYKSSGEKLFFWMQNKSDEKDEEYVSRVNRLINDPQSAVLEQSGSGGSSAHTRMPGIDVDFGDGAPPDMMQLLGNSPGIDRVSRENIIQFLQTAGGLGGTIPSSVPAGGDGPVDQPQGGEERHEQSSGDNNSNNSQQQSSAVNSEQLEQLRNILSGVQAPENHQAPLSLTDVLTTQTITPLLNDRDICAALFPFLPEDSERSPEEVRQVVQSPQFQQALATLSFALESGELGPLLTQLGLDASAGNSVESFLRAIEQQARRRDQDRNDDAMDED